MEVSVDQILEKLLAVKNSRGSKFVCLTFDELYFLCSESKRLFLSESSLLEIKPPVNVVGDIHGQYSDLLKLFDFTGHPPVPYLFLGDYVDRGKHSLETICLLLSYKLKYPNKVFLLRGNHEAANINKLYGFFDECKRRYDAKVWRAFIAVFDCLPVCALVGGRILAMHGGLSPCLNSLNDIRSIKRPTDVPDDGLLCDLLWADPDSEEGWRDNDRGVSYTFGPDVVQAFLQKFDLDLIARAHQVVEDGYQFFAKRGIVTIFSAPNYCNEWDNSGAVMSVDAQLVCSFHRLVPNTRLKRLLRKNNQKKPISAADGNSRIDSAQGVNKTDSTADGNSRTDSNEQGVNNRIDSAQGVNKTDSTADGNSRTDSTAQGVNNIIDSAQGDNKTGSTDSISKADSTARGVNNRIDTAQGEGRTGSNAGFVNNQVDNIIDSADNGTHAVHNAEGVEKQ